MISDLRHDRHSKIERLLSIANARTHQGESSPLESSFLATSSFSTIRRSHGDPFDPGPDWRHQLGSPWQPGARDHCDRHAGRRHRYDENKTLQQPPSRSPSHRHMPHYNATPESLPESIWSTRRAIRSYRDTSQYYTVARGGQHDLTMPKWALGVVMHTKKRVR